jgi:hypothetical protein
MTPHEQTTIVRIEIDSSGNISVGDIFNLTSFLTLLLLFYWFFYAIYHRMAQTFGNQFINLKSKPHLLEMPQRVFRFVHVLICSAIFMGICSGLLGHSLYLTRIFCTSFFLFDGILVTQLWFEYKQAPNLIKKLQLCCEDDSNANIPKTKDKIKIQNPTYNWFHHILTMFAFYGVSQTNRTNVLMTYMCGELALIFYNVTWFCCKCEWIRENITERRIKSLQLWTCMSYGLFRIFAFFVMGMCYIIPALMWSNISNCLFSSIMMFIFCSIWAMNVGWWLELCKTSMITPGLIGKVFNYINCLQK